MGDDDTDNSSRLTDWLLKNKLDGISYLSAPLISSLNNVKSPRFAENTFFSRRANFTGRDVIRPTVQLFKHIPVKQDVRNREPIASTPSPRRTGKLCPPSPKETNKIFSHKDQGVDSLEAYRRLNTYSRFKQDRVNRVKMESAIASFRQREQEKESSSDGKKFPEKGKRVANKVANRQTVISPKKQKRIGVTVANSKRSEEDDSQIQEIEQEIQDVCSKIEITKTKSAHVQETVETGHELEIPIKSNETLIVTKRKELLKSASLNKIEEDKDKDENKTVKNMSEIILIDDPLNLKEIKMAIKPKINKGTESSEGLYVSRKKKLDSPRDNLNQCKDTQIDNENNSNLQNRYKKLKTNENKREKTNEPQQDQTNSNTNSNNNTNSMSNSNNSNLPLIKKTLTFKDKIIMDRAIFKKHITMFETNNLNGTNQCLIIKPAVIDRRIEIIEKNQTDEDQLNEKLSKVIMSDKTVDTLLNEYRRKYRNMIKQK